MGATNFRKDETQGSSLKKQESPKLKFAQQAFIICTNDICHTHTFVRFS